jgi:hypothetical protein
MAAAAPGKAATRPRPIKGGSRARSCALASHPRLRAAASLLRASRRSRSRRHPTGHRAGELAGRRTIRHCGVPLEQAVTAKSFPVLR